MSLRTNGVRFYDIFFYLVAAWILKVTGELEMCVRKFTTLHSMGRVVKSWIHTNQECVFYHIIIYTSHGYEV
jgi:hypothetical protein